MVMKMLRKIYDNFLELSAILAFAGLIVLTLFQVLSRYLFTFPIAFSEEVGRFLFIWTSFLGSAIVMKKNEHIRLDLLQGKVPPRAYAVIQILVFAAVGVFSVLWLVQGLKLLDVASRQTAPVSRLSMGLVYFVMPLSGFFMAGFSVAHLLKAVGKLKGGAA